MKRILLALGIILVVGGLVWNINYRVTQLGGIGYPDPRYTTGELRTTDIKDICGNPTSVYRNVSEATKRRVYENYGVSYPQPQGKYEVDHYYPLGIGGSNDLKNLGLEPAPEFRYKDIVEADSRRRLCLGAISQKQAMEMIKNWRKTYDKIKENLGSIESENCPEGCP